MGEFFDQVTAKKDSAVALAHRAALFIDRSQKKVLLTEAGDDVLFYSGILRRLNLHSKLAIYSAEGRPKVLRALDALRALGKLEASYAIIDRDFDFDGTEPDREGHCFVLDVFSVENLFMNSSILEEVGVTFFALEDGSDSQVAWRAKVANFLRSLDDILIREHAIALHCVSNSKVCYLNNLNVLDLTASETNGAVVERNNAYTEFCRITSPDVEGVSEATIVACEEKIKAYPRTLTFRGHYFWALFVRLLNQFRLERDEAARLAGGSRARTRTSLTERHAFEAASPLLPTPPALEAFFGSAFG